MSKHINTDDCVDIVVRCKHCGCPHAFQLPIIGSVAFECSRCGQRLQLTEADSGELLIKPMRTFRRRIEYK